MIDEKFLGVFYQNALPISCPYLRQWFPSASAEVDIVYIDKNKLGFGPDSKTMTRSH
jgi:hypothetical protein